MPKQRLDLLARAHELMDDLPDTAILAELADDPDRADVVKFLNGLISKIGNEYKVQRSIALHAVSNVVEERRRARMQSGDPRYTL